MTRPESLRNLEFYDGGEETETYLARPYHQLRIEIMAQLVQEHVNLCGKAASALDIGCSTGTATEAILPAKVAERILGLDMSLKALQNIRHPCMTGTVADVAVSLPFRADCFDVIVAGEIIEHLVDVDAFLLEIRRCLKKNGVLVLSTPNLARLVDRIRFVFGITPKQTIPMHRYLRYHVTPFTFSSLRETLTRCRFDIVRFCSNYVYLDPTGLTKSQSHLLAQIFPSLGGSLIVAAKRAEK